MKCSKNTSSPPDDRKVLLSEHISASGERANRHYKRGKQELFVQAAEREENYEESVTETLRHSITNSFFGMWGICDFKPLHATATTVLMQSF